MKWMHSALTMTSSMVNAEHSRAEALAVESSFVPSDLRTLGLEGFRSTMFSISIILYIL